MREPISGSQLKNKVVNDFDKFLNRLKKGYQDNYELLLEEIAFIENSDYIDDVIYEYFMSKL